MNIIHFKSTAILFVLFVFANLSLIGQNPGRKEKVKDKLQAQRVAFITSELDLSEAESQKFWPIYNSYVAEKKELKSSIKEWPSNDMTDKEAEALLFSMLDTKSKEIEVQKKYIQKLKVAIPAKKIALLFRTEKEFKEKVISNMKDRRNQRQGQ